MGVQGRDDSGWSGGIPVATKEKSGEALFAWEAP
jgi:hypothetical protein